MCVDQSAAEQASFFHHCMSSFVPRIQLQAHSRSFRTLARTRSSFRSVATLRPIQSHIRTMSGLPTAQRSESQTSAPHPLLHLYTASTPNGFKVSILLEELALAYPAFTKEIGYDFTSLAFSENQQKSPEFLKINPNGRIPALVDEKEGGHRVFETSSIMLWLVDHYDKANKFWFADEKMKSEALSWIFFIHGGVGPMQGQANHFWCV